MAQTTLVHYAVRDLIKPHTSDETKARVHAQTDRVIHETIVFLDKMLVVAIDIPYLSLDEASAEEFQKHNELFKENVSKLIYNPQDDLAKNGVTDAVLVRMIAFELALEVLIKLPNIIMQETLKSMIMYAKIKTNK